YCGPLRRNGRRGTEDHRTPNYRGRRLCPQVAEGVFRRTGRRAFLMIHEFAVDPEALTGWQNFRYVVEKFGIPQGRLISRFPKEWKSLVYDACAACPPVEKA